MGVTIDSIQIEIESNSASASKGIDNFVASLETLKKSGKLTTVTKHLTNLSNAIKGFSNASKATSALGNLASAIEKLRSAGSIASQATNFTKLQTALKALETVDMNRVVPQLQKLSSALSDLPSIKQNGMSTLINSLAKLGDVTKSLDETTINAFVEKVKLLNKELGPLSEKMATVTSAFKAINTQAKKASESVEDFGDGINTSALNMSSFIEIARAAGEIITTIVNGYMNMVQHAIEWDGIASRFGRGFGAQAQETYEWIQRLNEEMGINVQQFMQYSSIYANMLTGFGVANADATKMALGYTELTYDIWAGYNDVYKNFEEASEAIKSAIAGEVEPIRRAGFTIVESTLEQTAANHGLEISLYNATEAQKSYLRYLTLVDQAHAQGLVGTYAKELNTAEGMMRTLAQQWKSLKQSLGALFLPILVKIVPYIQAIVDLLKEAVHWLANLLGVEIQSVDFSGYKAGAGAIDSVADSASGATDALDSATKAAKELKNATIGIDELNVISPSNTSGGSGNGGSGTGGVGSDGFAGLDVGSLWDKTIFDTIQSDVDKIKEKLKGWLPVIASVAVALGGLRLGMLLKDIKAIEATKLFAGKLKGFTGWIKAFVSLAKEGGVVATLAAAFPKLSTAISGVGTAFTALGGGWVVAIIAAIASVVVFLVKNWDELVLAVKAFFAENISPKLQEISKHFDKIKAVFKPVVDLFEKWGVVEKFGTVLEWVGGILFGISTAPLMGTINAVAQFIEGAVQTISGGIQFCAALFETFIGLVTFNGEKIKSGFGKMGTAIADVFGGLWSMTGGAIIEFFDGVIKWFTKLWDVLVGHSIVPDTVDAIVEWFTSLPSKIFGSIEKFATGMVGKFKGLWSSLTTWWNGKKKLSDYTPNIGSIYDKLKSRWDSARTWWNEKKTKAKDYTPNIGSIYDKLSDRWKNARDWWNNKKGSMSYTPTIGSITDKIKSAWSSAKTWWSKNAKLATKLDVSVPKITVKWDTASAFGKSFKYPTGFSLKFAANGGIFDQGSLIWAGERGPEVMANAGGGRTGVMNVQQMSEAMYDAVYSATIAANRASGNNSGGGVTKLYIDGREVTTSVEKTQHERGANILGFSF